MTIAVAAVLFAVVCSVSLLVDAGDGLVTARWLAFGLMVGVTVRRFRLERA